MWILYALLTILSYSGFDLFVKKTSGKIDDYLAVVIINIFSIIPALLFYIFFKFQGKEILFTREGSSFSIIAGILVGLASITFIKMFSEGANLSIGSPLVRVGTVILATLLGVLVLKETLTLKQIIGMTLSLTGLVLLFWK